MESPLFKFADPDLLLRRPVLSDEQNALFDWREAAALLAHGDEVSNLLCRGEEGCDCQQPECLACHPISDDEFVQRARRALAENASALESFATGLRRGQLQVPLHWPKIDDDELGLIQVRALARLLSLKAVLARHERDWPTAAAALHDKLFFGRMCATQGMFLQFVLGIAVQRGALGLIDDLAKRGAEKPVVRKLLGDLSLLVGPENFVDAIRGEFCIWALPAIEAIPAAGLTVQVDALMAACYAQQPISPSPEEPWVDDGRLAQRRADILYLLEGHAHPWDAADTVARVSSYYASWIVYLRAKYGPGSQTEPAAPPPSRVRRFCSWMMGAFVGYEETLDCSGWWPDSLSAFVDPGMLGSTPEAQRQRAEMAALIGSSPERWAPLTRSQLASWRKKVQRVRNPIGRLLAAQIISSLQDLVFEQLLELEQQTRQVLQGALGATA